MIRYEYSGKIIHDTFYIYVISNSVYRDIRAFNINVISAICLSVQIPTCTQIDAFAPLSVNVCSNACSEETRALCKHTAFA